MRSSDVSETPETGGNATALPGSGPAVRSAADPSGIAAPGFWLPKAIRGRLLSDSTKWEGVRFAYGRECGVECAAAEASAVEARWPLLGKEEWNVLLDALAEARARAPRGEEFWVRLQAALPQAASRLAQPEAETGGLLAQTLPAYTGFSPAMIAAILQAPDTWNLHSVASSFAYRPTKAQSAHWQPLADLPGRVRFFPDRAADRWAAWIPVARQMPLFGSLEPPKSVVGYGAGNVPGTALVITLLALATTLVASPPPVVLVRNSRREPLFSPLVLSALEAVDEELVATVALLVWDYDDRVLQDRLLGQADLVLAAAGDDTIGRIAAALRRGASARTRPARFYPHGHKVSFAVVGREMAEHLHVVSLLTALDSAFWDQFGCLSARIHFVEKADLGDWMALDYCQQLVSWLRRLSQVLPRGAWPLRQLRDTYDRYKALETAPGAGGAVRVLSAYEDPFVVVLDERETRAARPDPFAFMTAVNDCQGRVVIARPVFDLLQIPRFHLSLLPASSLQSLSVAVGHPGEGLGRRFLEFATACGACGVTAIRIAGQAAFPRLAYSWDGFLPLDLVYSRPPGHFTTIEFDSPFEAMMESYQTWMAKLGFLSRDGASPHTSAAPQQARDRAGRSLGQQYTEPLTP